MILVAVMHFTELMYETNDDYSISCKIAEGYPYVGFVNYFLCRLLILMAPVFPETNIFVLSQIAISFVAFVVVLKVIFERNEEFFESALAVAVVAFFSFDHYCSVQFTKTSALLMAAGLLYVADTYTHSRSPLSFFIGFLLYFTGVCYRQMGLFPAAAYIAVFMIIWWMLNGREYFKGRSVVRETVLVIVIVSFIIAPYGFDKLSDRMNAGTPELALAREYQALRVRITDYPVLDNYDRFADEYEEAGISKNDVAMIDRFMIDYDGGASLENLRTINRINAPAASGEMTIEKAEKKFLKKVIKSVNKRDFTGMHILFLIGMAAFMLIVTRPKSWLYIVIIGALTAGLYITINYMQRTNYRAFYVADVSAAIWLMYVIASQSRGDKPRKTWHMWLERLLCIIFAAMILSYFPKEASILAAKSAHNAEVVETEEIKEYLRAHPDNFYVMPTPKQKWPDTYLKPLAPAKMQENCTNTGGWEAMTPSRLNFLKKHGMSNPIKDLIDAPNKYIFGKYKFDMLNEYYNKWYGGEDKTIIIEKIDEVDEIGIYRVVSVDS